jgi:hypothetical protein
MIFESQVKRAPAAQPRFRQGNRSRLQRTCACGGLASQGGECEGCRKRRRGALQRHATSAEPDQVSAIMLEPTRSSGQQLELAVRGFTQAGFGHDVSRVRVHARSQPGTLTRQKSGALAQPPQQTGGAAGTRSPATAAGSQLPTCNMQAVDQWIPDPKKPKQQLPGLTELAGVGGTQSDFRLGPAPGGKGFVVLPTAASLPPIQSKFLKTGRYPDRSMLNFRPQADSSFSPRPGGYVNVWEITQEGSSKLQAAEQEHCNDFRLAFYLSFYRFAEFVNDMANKGTLFASQSAARATLAAQVKIDPANLPAYFKCVSEWMQRERDDKKWHTPRVPPVDSIAYDDTVRDLVAIRKFTASALPEVDKHSSGDLFFNGAAPACVQLTTLAPTPSATQPQGGSQLHRDAEGEVERTEVPPIVLDVLGMPGEPLGSVTQELMESQFDHDFSLVRVHADKKAAESARRVNATAYTVGSHIIFGEGRFRPDDAGGRRLLSHELAHVIQQEHASADDVHTIAPVDDPMEREAVLAETNADMMLSPDRMASLRRQRPPDAGTAVSLSYIKGAPKQGQCGDYEWQIRWVLNGATSQTNGFIVQKAKAAFLGETCDNKRADTFDIWWEAWQVKGGKIMSGISDRESLGDEFRSVNTVGTKGTQYSTGAAKFIENYSEPLAWGKLKQAGPLPATTSAPPGWSESGSKYRFIGVSDYTCCEEPRQRGKLTTEELDV